MPFAVCTTPRPPHRLNPGPCVLCNTCSRNLYQRVGEPKELILYPDYHCLDGRRKPLHCDLLG